MLDFSLILVLQINTAEKLNALLVNALISTGGVNEVEDYDVEKF